MKWLKVCAVMQWTWLVSAMAFGADDRSASFAVLPARVQLGNAAAQQRILVQRRSGEETGAPLVDGVELRIADEKVARLADGMVVPVGNGSTTLTARHGGVDVSVPITVTGLERAPEWTFRNHVQAVLAKLACNSGACHGALAGKGGFKLSLRGYNTAADYHTITRQAQGRRIELGDPGRSLLLTKPSGALPHKGGVRFETDSMAYRILSEWIAAGAPGPAESDPELTRLEVLPETVVLQPKLDQQFIVLAHYSDGHVEDVTRWTKYTSANEAVATVDDQGRVSVVGSGEGAITAWFSQKIVIARITSPYPNQVPPEVFATADRRNFIDELVLRQLERLRLPPSGPCSDAEFIRRAFLDTTGGLPTAQEVTEFLAETSADKRDKLIESLLARPEFVDYWTYRWSDLLLISGENLRPQAVKTYYHWIRDRVAKNTPWDQFVRELVTAQGSTFENGATNFFALHQDPEGMSENVSQAFLGLSINCARCHNHPLEKWTNDQYYAMANLFARVRAKGWGGDPRSGDGRRTVHVVDRGELLQPRTGKPQPPAPLDGEPIALESPVDRRVHLANWLTSPENPYFARSITNRIWSNFFGVGLVEPVDDMRVSNPASNEALLQAAAQFLVDHHFDLKQLIRVILQSKTYQRTSVALAENQAEERFYSRYYPRRLMAEVLLDAISQVTEVPSEFNEIAYPGADRQKTDFYPKGTRALQLYDAAVASYFLRTFGRNQRLITCECERSDEPSMVQVLHLSNGDTINQKLRAAGNRIDKLMQAGASDAEIVEQAYLIALARYPSEAERTGLQQAIAEVPSADRRLALEDLFWSLLSSREFLFNH